MAWGFRKRITLLPGLKLNLSKSGVSATIGPRGASVNVGKKGTFLNIGIPGTGLYNRTKISGGAASRSRKVAVQEEPYDQGLVDSALPLLNMTVTELTHLGGTEFHFNFGFSCKSCGSSMISLPEDGAEDGEVTCKECNAVFGTLGTVKTVGRYIGIHEAKRRGYPT